MPKIKYKDEKLYQYKKKPTENTVNAWIKYYQDNFICDIIRLSSIQTGTKFNQPSHRKKSPWLYF